MFDIEVYSQQETDFKLKGKTGREKLDFVSSSCYVFSYGKSQSVGGDCICRYTTPNASSNLEIHLTVKGVVELTEIYLIGTFNGTYSDHYTASGISDSYKSSTNTHTITIAYEGQKYNSSSMRSITIEQIVINYSC